MNVTGIGSTYNLIYNAKTEKLSTKDGRWFGFFNTSCRSAVVFKYDGYIHRLYFRISFVSGSRYKQRICNKRDTLWTDKRKNKCDYVDTVMIHVVFSIYYSHFICPFHENLKAFQSVHHNPFILCYNVLCNFLSLIFSLIRVRNALWEDITQGKL